ncbi:leucine-rich repeat-containing protein, partial [Asbolus verrucosus]
VTNMWKGPGQDPGGGSDSGPPPGSSQELSDLKDQFEQQQVLIAQLKEMIRKNEQSNVTQEKVDEYMNTLSKRSARAKKLKKDEDNGNRKTLDIPASQKINLLRQQVEENKAKFAERGKSQKGIEEMVTQLKAQLDDSQQLINQTPLNLTMQDTKTDYNENSSSQELYMILLTKEKRITDLISKVQKLESNVLDLQENLKEKDSVIDARTKAITLMTESLSRKGKTTLDALDETKDQMRKMQENFVALEAEMKARQMKLLEDLRLKNYEIAELQELNSSLHKENNELKERCNDDTINELKEKIQQLEEHQQEYLPIAENEKLLSIITEHEATIKKLNDTVDQLRSVENKNVESDTLAKLKKQLDESNKNMIKVKAQHKSKVKELTKKIETFKKISDTNAEIVKLESENCRLSQKVAELEEEKGSLQLKLVESDSVKGSDFTERENELEEKIQDHMRDLEEKDKIISLLEIEISRSKNDIEILTEKMNSLSHLENAQVTSEMASIQFEEQMDSLEKQKKELMMENENTIKEKEELLETIDVLKKEKQEMATKLEHYIQENMELIDKLEKLSAEKVSSAESIEIVEGLTQQEKLELEAYQKNLDMVAGNLKCSEENLPQNVDLNESVNELTEETSELLQKIELFTVERREVMEKMEQLKQENSTLNLKIKEIENNRDVLAETYEQLQNEKELLDTKLEIIKKESEGLKEELRRSSQHANNEDQNNQLVEKNETLKQQLEEELKRNNELREETDNYKALIEEKRNELEKLQSDLQTREKEITQLNSNIIDLNRALSDYENDNKNLQIKVDQLEEHKANLIQLIDKNQEELEAISNTEWENRRLLESKDNEITKLMKERDNTESVIVDLQKVIKDKDEKFNKISSDLKEKYLTLQKQLEHNSGNLQKIAEPLEAKIEELTTKNRDQLEKMKKIAANLKKKTQAYQELENKFKDTQNKHDVELKSLLQQLQDLETEVSKVRQQYDNKVEEARVLEERNVELQNIVTDLKVKIEKTNEVSLQQELLLTRENLGSIESSLQTKIQELEMIIETQESELTKSRDRVNKLEEGIAFVEERRLSLERRANDLGAELEEKSVTCEEMYRSEDMLEKRLAALAAHDEAIEKKLEEAVAENQDLNQQNKNLSEKNNKLKKKLEQVMQEMQKVEDQQSVVEELVTQNENLKKQLHHLENEINVYERTIEENKNDFDKINGDWQSQFDEILEEKTELMIKCEKFEELKEITESFNDELIEYKMKLEKSEIEIQNYEKQIQKLLVTCEELENSRKIIEDQDAQIQNYQKQNLDYEKQLQDHLEANKELENLKKIIEEKDTLIEKYKEQIQKSPVENKELENLKKIIQEKNVEIDSYRKLQLQVQGSSILTSYFDSAPTPQNPVVCKLQEELAVANNHLDASKLKIEELQKKIEDLELKKTAEVTVDSVISEAEIKTSPRETIPTFVWSSQNNDPFDFIEEIKLTNQETVPQIIDNTQQELLDKIKTLEFMLFNSEKEKDEALLQCHELTNELTRLVYERQMPPQSNLESQILSESDIRDTTDTCKELQKIEFEATKPPQVSSLESGPIVEEVVHAKEAYLCFDEETDSRKIDSQIVSDSDIVDTPETRRELQQLEFEETRPPVSSTDCPIKEDKCSSKEAYLCYTFGENDDGWGWGPEEAKLEEEHAQKTDTAPLKLIDTFKEKIRVLELERENYLEEIKQLQIKSGKLIKKLKEFKQKNEELNQSRKKSEGDLIDVLTSANERMVEMKEKQDIELLGWQQNYRDLSAKLERFEWGDDGFSLAEHPSKEKLGTEDNESLEVLNRKIQELNETIKDLTLDNEELQTLLEEQRNLRINAEKSKSKKLQDQVNELIKKNTEMLHKFEDVEQQNSELTILISTKDEIVKRLEQKLFTIEEEKRNVAEEKESHDLTEEKEIASNVTSLSDELLEKRNLIDELIREKEVLFKELQEKNAQIDSLKESVDAQIASLKSELENQTKSAQVLLEENKGLADRLSEKDVELTRLSVTLEQMAQEWELRVDQRGNDVAESWKLHLESRETEFAQIEQLLKKEINELEEKTNALVNENNELRKNVDAEIRNEVDRVAALQQQISDRQQYINELTRTLQEKQIEIDALQQELNRKNEEFRTTKLGFEEEKEIVDVVLKVLQENSNKTLIRSGDCIANMLSEKENMIVSLRKDLEDIKLNLSQLQERQTTLLEEKNETIATLTSQLQEVQNLKDYESENAQNLQQNLFEYQQINATITTQLQMKSTQLEEREAEVNNLKQLLEEKQRQHDYTLENLSHEYRTSINEQAQEIDTLKRRLLDNENHYEELLATKDEDIEELRNQSQLVEKKNKEAEELGLQLNEKIKECGSLQKKIDEQNVLLDEENKQVTEFRAIIEVQVLKIEELKTELFEKSNDYDSLIAEMDISRNSVKENEETARPKIEDEDLTEPVSRAELDLALYMLHQRDVRCEELTVELTQLLEERDTLQLRLSNVIREKEELGRRITREDDSVQASASSGRPELEIVFRLSELKTVGYRKDKTIVDEQESRRLQQLSIMQQHRDVASKLPPEAAARLVDASYTL